MNETVLFQETRLEDLHDMLNRFPLLVVHSISVYSTKL